MFLAPAPRILAHYCEESCHKRISSCIIASFQSFAYNLLTYVQISVMFMSILYYPLCILLVFCIFLMKVTKEYMLLQLPYYCCWFLANKNLLNPWSFYLLCVLIRFNYYHCNNSCPEIVKSVSRFSNVKLQAWLLSIELCFFSSFEIHLLLGFRCFDILCLNGMTCEKLENFIDFLWVLIDFMYWMCWSWWGHGRPWPDDQAGPGPSLQRGHLCSTAWPFTINYWLLVISYRPATYKYTNSDRSVNCVSLVFIASMGWMLDWVLPWVNIFGI